MRKIKCIVLLLLSVLMLSSCKTKTHTKARNHYLPDIIRLDINMNDLVVAGETEINVSYFKYLGFLFSIQEINGEVYDPYNVTKTDIDRVHLSERLQKAAIKVVDEYPGAAYYQVVHTKKIVEPFMFGKEIKETALIRVYNFK